MTTFSNLLSLRSSLLSRGQENWHSEQILSASISTCTPAVKTPTQLGTKMEISVTQFKELVKLTCRLNWVKPNSLSFLPQNLSIVSTAMAQEWDLISLHFLLSINNSVENIQNHSFSESAHLQRESDSRHSSYNAKLWGDTSHLVPSSHISCHQSTSRTVNTIWDILLS